MKNIFKIIPLLLLAFTVSCDESDSRFSGEDPTSGWVEFTSSGTTISIITEQLSIPIEVNVPVYENGLNVSYTLEPVQGDFSSIVTTGDNVFVDPTVINRNGAAITLNFSGVGDLDEIVVFDVVLTAVDVNTVNVGVDDNSITRFRVSTPCPIDIDSFAGTYTVEEMFTGPPNGPNGLSFFFGESYQIDLSVNTEDVTETSVIISNSPGFDQYIANGTIMSFDTCNFTVSFSEDPLELALFNTLVIESSSYTDAGVITAIGPFGNFGEYMFTLTRQ